MLLVRLGHVLDYRRRSGWLIRADMRRHAYSPMKDLHRLRRQARFHLLVNQRVRHTVEVPLDVDAGRLPLPELVACGRQRLQRRPVQLREQGGTVALELVEASLVEPREQLGDRLVGFVRREELAFAQRRDYPSLDNLNSHFHLGFVLRPVRARRNNRRAVVRSHLAVCGIEIRLVITRVLHAGFAVIRNQDLGHAAEELEGPDMRADPVAQILPQRDLGEGVVAGPQHGHEHSAWLAFLGLRIVDRNCGAGIVHEHLFASAVFLPQY